MNPTANESLHFHMENSNNPQKIDILVKKNCQDLLKTQNEKLAMKKYGDVYFYAWVSFSDTNFMGGEYLNESCKMIYSGRFTCVFSIV